MLNAIVMAAGKGTRMHSQKAKTMHKLLDQPMLEHIYDTLQNLNCDNTVYVVGHGKDEIKDYFKDKVEYAIQEPQLGTAHAVSVAGSLKDKEGKTLIINGDCPLVTEETYQKVLEVAQEYPLVVLTTVLDDPASYGRIIRDGQEVVRIVERKDANEEQVKINEINVGIYCVDNALLWKHLPEIGNDNKQHEYYITDLVEVFRKNGLKVGAYCCEDYRQMQGINSRKELIEATKWLQEKINNYWLDNGVTIIDPSTTYIGRKVVIGEDTIIYPNVRIEGNSVIGKDNVVEEGSYFNNVTIGDGNHIIASMITDSSVGNSVNIGPNAHLRNGCEIGNNCRIGNYVEMKNTRFGNGSKCAHLTYVGDATVGEKCNFGCGVVTVNYDGKNKFRCEIGDHVFVGSNVNLIAPVKIEDYSVLAAGSTITDDVAAGEMAIARSRQINKPDYGYRYLNK